MSLSEKGAGEESSSQILVFNWGLDWELKSKGREEGRVCEDMREKVKKIAGDTCQSIVQMRFEKGREILNSTSKSIVTNHSSNVLHHRTIALLRGNRWKHSLS